MFQPESSDSDEESDEISMMFGEEDIVIEVVKRFVLKKILCRYVSFYKVNEVLMAFNAWLICIINFGLV